MSEPKDLDWKQRVCGDCTNLVEYEMPQQGPIIQANRPKVSECREGPPHSIPIPIPTPKGLNLQVNTSYVKVNRDYPACRRFDPIGKGIPLQFTNEVKTQTS